MEDKNLISKEELVLLVEKQKLCIVSTHIFKSVKIRIYSNFFKGKNVAKFWLLKKPSSLILPYFILHTHVGFSWRQR